MHCMFMCYFEYMARFLSPLNYLMTSMNADDPYSDIYCRELSNLKTYTVIYIIAILGMRQSLISHQNAGNRKLYPGTAFCRAGYL